MITVHLVCETMLSMKVCQINGGACNWIFVQCLITSVDYQTAQVEVFGCMIVNVFCNGIEQEEDGNEEVCFGIIVCAVVFLNGSC